MNKKFLHRAIQLAIEKSSDGRHGPFGAVIAKDDDFIAEGWNDVVNSNDPTAHAEISAIRKACQKVDSYNLSGYTMYSSCEPCPMCLSAIYWARIDTIVFAATRQDAAQAGFDDALQYDEIRKTWEDRELKASHELEDEGKAVLEKWKANPKRIAY